MRVGTHSDGKETGPTLLELILRLEGEIPSTLGGTP